jgi:tRNA pseudouridine32 synthase/23S rRNA pseudouridine746 synthase
LFLYYNEQVLQQTAPPAELVEDGGRWSLWLKPAGMRAQGSRWGDHTTLGRFAERHLHPPRTSFIVHRLDLATCGLALLAHDRKAAAHISAQFAARSVTKGYHATVYGKFPGADLPQTYTSDIDGKYALTRARRIVFDPHSGQSLLEIDIESGRKHQIRRHLAAAGFPVVGDALHGRGGDPGPMLLCASSLAFNSPENGARHSYSRPPTEWPLFSLVT